MRLLPVRPDHVGERASLRKPHPDDADIDAAMAGNICRCGTYVRIREAIKLARRARVRSGCTHSSDLLESKTRRDFLKGAATGGAFVLAFHMPRAARLTNRNRRRTTPKASSRPTLSSASTKSGTTTLVMPQVEMGQGVYTAVAMISPKNSTPISRKSCSSTRLPNEKLYANPMFGIQATGGFEFAARLLDAAAHRGRHGARHARRRPLRRNGRSILQLHDRAWRGDCTSRHAIAGFDYGALIAGSANGSRRPQMCP
jgi:hypothetical protein